MIWTAPLVIVGSLLLFGLASLLLRRRYPENEAPLVEAIDRLLPQTQCAQCGYPGCRPYAEAIADGAPTNLCPPGGAQTHRALDELMGLHTPPPPAESNRVAVVDESNCIGCALCLPACPVDAIIGANGYMHTVIEKECTGCELCVPACPVDCISMDDREKAAFEPAPSLDRARPCISCGVCVPACPVDLDPQRLLHAALSSNTELAASQSIDRCIECGLCDRTCPSEIPLAAIFGHAKIQVRQAESETTERLRLKERYAAHLARRVELEKAKDSRREARLSQPRSWS